MIKVLLWNTETKTVVWAGTEALEGEASEKIVWIDLDDPTVEEELQVYQKFFPVHALTLEDITFLRRSPDGTPHLPKAEEFPDYLFVLINPLSPEMTEHLQDGTPHPTLVTTQLSGVMTEEMLITRHVHPMPSVEKTQKYLTRHKNQIKRGPDFIFHLILDNTVDEFSPLLDHLEAQLDTVEETVFDRPDGALLRDLLSYKQVILLVRKTLILEREILAKLSLGEFEMIDERERVYYRNVYDHILRSAAFVDASRERVSDLLQMHLAAASNQMNGIMKVLAMISTILLPMTLIAGIYGMNFDRLPGKEYHFGFEWSLVLMLLGGVLSLLFFRWKKWL